MQPIWLRIHDIIIWSCVQAERRDKVRGKTFRSVQIGLVNGVPVMPLKDICIFNAELRQRNSWVNEVWLSLEDRHLVSRCVIGISPCGTHKISYDKQKLRCGKILIGNPCDIWVVRRGRRKLSAGVNSSLPRKTSQELCHVRINHN